MGDVIQFRLAEVDYWPWEWVTPYNPTLYELRVTLETIRRYYTNNVAALDNCGVSAEIEILENIDRLSCMYWRVMQYYKL